MGSLGSFWGQEGSMIEKTSKMGRLVSPMGGEFGSQNRSKIDPGVIKKMIIFCIDF